MCGAMLVVTVAVVKVEGFAVAVVALFVDKEWKKEEEEAEADEA